MSQFRSACYWILSLKSILINASNEAECKSLRQTFDCSLFWPGLLHPATKTSSIYILHPFLMNRKTTASIPFLRLNNACKSLGIGLEENLVLKKSLGTCLGENLVPKKVPEPVLVRFLGLVTHWIVFMNGLKFIVSMNGKQASPLPLDESCCNASQNWLPIGQNWCSPLLDNKYQFLSNF